MFEEFKGKKFLITGGAGLLGLSLTKKLISAGKKNVEQYRWTTITDQVLKVYKKQLKLNVTKGGKVKTTARPIVGSI